MRRTTRALIIPVLLAGALALAGCSAGGGSAGSRAVEGGTDTSQGSAPQSTTRDAAPAEGKAAAAQQGRDQVLTGMVRMRAESAIATARRASAIVLAAGGRVDGRSETPRSGDSPASTTLTLRIPASKVDGVLARLSALGERVSVSTDAADVTATRQDTAARISALQRSIAAFEGFLATAKSTQDLISLESAISDRQAELESLQAQQRGLDDQIALATITLDVREAPPVVARAPGDYGTGLAAGWAAFVAFLSWLLVVLGGATPWLALAGAVLAAVLGARRILRRRRPTAPTPPAAPPAPAG
ncbi:MAG: DUF4349 domain-containing protein [Micrococcales bacterium]|nr:DUF4349 domain-containing protein [Micrococcales bacterium]